MESVLRPGGDTADPHNKSILPVSMQELASGASAIEPFGPETGGEIVYVDISVYPAAPQTFKLRCGLAFDGSVP